jgi:hypothetical protein
VKIPEQIKTALGSFDQKRVIQPRKFILSAFEDTFVSLARNRAALATFSIDETNDRSTWGACRARRPSWARRSLRCDDPNNSPGG